MTTARKLLSAKLDFDILDAARCGYRPGTDVYIVRMMRDGLPKPLTAGMVPPGRT